MATFPRLGRRARSGLLLACCVVPAAPAAAADPIMPLSEVRSGMRCTGLTVVRGTEVSSFDVEVLDVIAGDRADDAPRILVRVSGPDVDVSGIGSGFSGSPVLCPGGDGEPRNAGAISETIGEYGGSVGLATPIESVLGLPVEPPAATRRDAALLRRARPVALPLSLSGVAPSIAARYSRAARRAGRLLVTAPARPRAGLFPPQQLRPGASMAVGLASGDVSAGAVGTVTYVDGDRVWGFGHGIDSAGRRSLLLQDAYVYTVINNPVQLGELASYKLAVPGHVLGTLSADGLSSVAGRLGTLPPRFPMKVVAHDGDTGTMRVLGAEIADESAVGNPAGGSPFGLVGSALVAQAAVGVLGANPAQLSGQLCARVQVRQLERPLRFCNRYVGGSGALGGEEDGGAGTGLAMAGDVAAAAELVDGFPYAALDVTGAEVTFRLHRGLRQALMLRGRAPSVVRRGRTVPVRLTLRRHRGPRLTRTVRVRVPRGMPAGDWVLTLTGPSSDAGGSEADLAALFEDGPQGADDEGPRTLRGLAREVRRIGRWDGVHARFLAPGEDVPAEGEDAGEGAEAVARRARRVHRDPQLRISGRVRIPVTVR